MKLLLLFLVLPIGPLIIAAPMEPHESGPSTSAFAPAAEQLSHLVETLVARDEAVGAELLVVHQGAPILHRTFGYRDREAKEPMAPDSLFAIRSMTKPFTGMAAQLLIEEGKLELDAPVAKYLPSFDNEKSRGITVRHLLTHRSGLPLGALPPGSKPLAAYSGVGELAELSGAAGPAFAPGSKFLYSDAGSDALAAVVSAVSKSSLEDFMQRRVLAPLGLTETVPEAAAIQVDRRGRVASRYSGMTGGWTRYWSPADAPVYPFLKGSGGLYSTARDYARFLQFWMDRRTGEGGLVLPAAAVERALEAASQDTMTTGFSGAVCDYGQMWMLFRDVGGEGKTFAFGHGGSDGTYAYAFPAHDLVVVFLTQTRGTTAGRAVESAISHLFLSPDPTAFDRIRKMGTTDNVAEFLGLYARGNQANSIGAMIAFDGGLAFELSNRRVMSLRPTEDRDRWVPVRAPNDSVVFRREEGRVTGFTLVAGGRSVEADRFRPDPALPTPEDVIALRSQAVPAASLQALLPLRVRLAGEARGQTFSGTVTIVGEDQSLTELDFGAAGMMKVWTNAGRAWRQLPGANDPVELTGLERAEELNGTVATIWGNWRAYQDHLTVLSREKVAGEDVLRVRIAPPGGFASTKLVNATTGAVLVEYGISVPPGAGALPVEVRYDDFRSVEGVTVSFAQTVILPDGLANAARLRIVEVEPRVAVDSTLMSPAGKESR